MKKTKSFLRSNPPAVAQFIIYGAAGMVLLVGVLMLMSIEEMIEGWFDESVVGSIDSSY